MYEFIKMVMAVVLGMFIYDKSIEILNRNRLDLFYKDYDLKKRNEE